MSIVQVNDLRKIYQGGFEALKDAADFAAEAGVLIVASAGYVSSALESTCLLAGAGCALRFSQFLGWSLKKRKTMRRFPLCQNEQFIFRRAISGL